MGKKAGEAYFKSRCFINIFPCVKMLNLYLTAKKLQGFVVWSDLCASVCLHDY